FGAFLLFLEGLDGVADVVLNDVVPENHTGRLSPGKKLGQAKGLGYTAFAILISVVQMLQIEVAAVAEQAQKIAGIFAARDEENFLNAGIHECLDGIIHHRLVIDRKQVLVSDAREWVEPASRSASEHDALHLFSDA